MRGNRDFPDQNERRIITTVVSPNTFELSAPLNFTHWGVGDERAEVGLITRNIVFRGDSSSESDGFGGHIIFRRVSSCRIEGAEFTFLGQMGVVGRYPIHFIC